MDNASRWRWLGASVGDRLVNGLFLFATLALVAVVAGQRWPHADAPPGRYAAGDPAPAIAGIRFEAQDRLLLLFAHTRCRFCNESMAFYQQLGERVAASHGAVRFVVASPEPVAELTAHLKRHRVTPTSIVTVDPDGVRVRGTPTMVLVNRAGRVEAAWEGKLSAQQEEEVLSVLRSGRS
jgi:hypothetical protein